MEIAESLDPLRNYEQAKVVLGLRQMKNSCKSVISISISPETTTTTSHPSVRSNWAVHLEPEPRVAEQDKRRPGA